MEFLDIAAIRRREQVAIDGGIPPDTLMERAGAGLARSLARLLRARDGDFCLFVAGRGNNGGDAYVAARLLESWGWRCEVRLTCPPGALRGAARNAWDQYEARRDHNGAFDILDNELRWRESRPDCELPPRAVVVDALLGTGARGAPAGVTAAAIDWIGRAASNAFIVAVDIPSGMNADTGETTGETVRAGLTVTFDAPKRGFQHPRAWPWLGRVETVGIGLSDGTPQSTGGTPAVAAAAYSASEATEEPLCDCLTTDDLVGLTPPRPRDSHKGHYGHVLVIGGSSGMGGAPALAALAALRSGAGLVSALVSTEAVVHMAVLAPEVMCHTVPLHENFLDVQVVRTWLARHRSCDTLVVGPGLGTGAGARALVAMLLADPPARMVLDADALNILALHQPLPRADAAAPKIVLTPHPGEAARLLGCSVAEVQADRPAAVRRLADATGAVVVLKGCATLICAPGGRPRMNLAGNPGMATGGSGDVLAGVVGALGAQGLDPWNAAGLGVYLHATAGDLAAWRGGERALVARDIVAALGEAAATVCQN